MNEELERVRKEAVMNNHSHPDICLRAVKNITKRPKFLETNNQSYHFLGTSLEV
jgi:hypothetical protein